MAPQKGLSTNRAGRKRQPNQRPGKEHEGQSTTPMAVDGATSSGQPSGMEVQEQGTLTGTDLTEMESANPTQPFDFNDPGIEPLAVRQRREMADLKAALALEKQATVRELEERHLREQAEAAEREKLQLRAKADALRLTMRRSHPGATVSQQLPPLPCPQSVVETEPHLERSQSAQLTLDTAQPDVTPVVAGPSTPSRPGTSIAGRSPSQPVDIDAAIWKQLQREDEDHRLLLEALGKSGRDNLCASRAKPTVEPVPPMKWRSLKSCYLASTPSKSSKKRDRKDGCDEPMVDAIDPPLAADQICTCRDLRRSSTAGAESDGSQPIQAAEAESGAVTLEGGRASPAKDKKRNAPKTGLGRPTSGECKLDGRVKGPVSKASCLSAAGSLLSPSSPVPRSLKGGGQKRIRHSPSARAAEMRDTRTVQGRQPTSGLQAGPFTGIEGVSNRSEEEFVAEAEPPAFAAPPTPTPPQTRCSKRKQSKENCTKAEGPSALTDEDRVELLELGAHSRSTPTQDACASTEGPASKKGRPSRAVADLEAFAAGLINSATPRPKRAPATPAVAGGVGSGPSADGGTAEACGHVLPKGQSAAGRRQGLRPKAAATGAAAISKKKKAAGGKARPAKGDLGVQGGDRAQSSSQATASGSSLSFDDVMRRRMPAHRRFGFHKGRSVRVTPPKPVDERRYRAKIRELSPAMQAQMQGFREWYRNPPPDCLVDGYKSATVTQIENHLLGMMGWMKRTRGTALETLLLRDLVPSHEMESATLGRDFVRWMRTKRHASDATLRLVYRSLLPLSIYLHHAQSKADPTEHKSPYHDVPVIRQYRNFAKLLRRKAEKTSTVSDENLKWVDWERILTLLLPELHSECAGLYDTGRERTPLAVFKSIQLYVMFAIAAVCPDRQRTLRELQLGVTLHKVDGRYWIRLRADDHKTGKTAGDRPDFLLPEKVSKQVDDFLQVWRPLFKTKHDFVFTQKNGKPLQPSTVTSMFKAAAFRICGQQMNPQMMRKAVVTHFNNNEASDRELASLAACMGHRVETQRAFYDRRTPSERGEPAFKMIAKVYERLTDASRGGPCGS